MLKGPPVPVSDTDLPAPHKLDASPLADGDTETLAHGPHSALPDPSLRPVLIPPASLAYLFNVSFQGTEISRPDEARCSASGTIWARIGRDQALKTSLTALWPRRPHCPSRPCPSGH